MDASPQLVVGTAGHIDHGKSSLVLALTGTDPDRLPEEKARGMTIELGFAWLRAGDADVWFVDVPGHERFIRTMLAGATGIDVALLIVAADDAIMPQTREHAELLALLGVQRCVLVLTKIDLVDEEWVAVVEQEARELLAGVGLAPVASVRTSAQRGDGIEELRGVLGLLARHPNVSPGDGSSAGYSWFRLPIDRAFNVAGRGTVVTGSVLHGAVQREDELELWPAGRVVRVRDLQSHNEGRAAAGGRMRLAVNLAGLSLEDVERGCELAAPGYLEPTRCLDGWLTLLRMPGKTRRQRLRLRVHLATTEVLAELRLAGRPDADVVRDVPAQLITATPVVAAWGQRFVVRDESGSRTLGGGTILRPVSRLATAKRPLDAVALARLRPGGGGDLDRTESIVRDAGWGWCGERRLAARAGLSDEAAARRICTDLMATKRVEVLEAPGARVLVHVDVIDAAATALVTRLTAHLKANPRLAGVARGEWAGWMPRACPAKLRPALAERLLTVRKVALSGAFVVPPGHAGAMSPDDAALSEALLHEFHAGAFQPPAVDALKSRTPKNERRVRELIELAAARGQLVRIGDGIWLHGERWHELIERVTATIRARGDVSVADVRELTQSSRKFIVPILEKLDAAGVTKRAGDKRILGPRAAAEKPA